MNSSIEQSVNEPQLIIGAGGGGKGGGGSARVAQEAADSLRSKAFARVVDLVCEGEIQGLANGLKSVYQQVSPSLRLLLSQAGEIQV